MQDPSPSDFARLVAAAGAYQSTRDRYWLTRHYVAASTLITFCISVLAPDSLNARAISAAGPLGWYIVVVLGVVSLASLLEALITAFVPRLTCDWLRRQRHLIFMVIALGQLCLAYAVLAYAPQNWVLILRFSLDATVATLLAFLDLFARHKADYQP
jgi:hypothetical protein